MPRTPRLRAIPPTLTSSVAAFFPVQLALATLPDGTRLHATDQLVLSAVLNELVELNLMHAADMRAGVGVHSRDTDTGRWRRIKPGYLLDRYPLIDVGQRRVRESFERLGGLGLLATNYHDGWWLKASTKLVGWAEALRLDERWHHYYLPQYALLSHPTLGCLHWPHLAMATVFMHALHLTSLQTLTIAEVGRRAGVHQEKRQLHRYADDLAQAGVIQPIYTFAGGALMYAAGPLLPLFNPVSDAVEKANLALWRSM